MDPKTEDKLNQVPLYYAVREGHNQIIELLLEHGTNINHLDTYGQTPIFYCIREGNIETTQQLVNAGAEFDTVDTNGQTPIYYAIKQNRYEMVEYLLKRGINISHEDKRGQNPSAFAKRHNKNQLVELLVQHGAIVNEKKKVVGPPKPVQPKAQEERQKVNERKIPRRYLLTKLREGGYYEPLTDEEFEQFKVENPDVAKYFLVDENGADTIAPISELHMPQVNEGAAIYDHWEKAALRMMMTLGRNGSAWIFQEPVNVESLNIPDYFNIVKKPMDFGTIKGKLKEQRYESITEYMEDMELVFYNCKLYNGEVSGVG